MRETRQAQIFGSLAEPAAGRLLASGAIAADSQILPEIFLGIADAKLCLARKHGLNLRRHDRLG